MSDVIEFLVQEVRSMKPGQRLKVYRSLVHQYERMATMIGTPFSAPDRVLEKIVGSGYEYGYAIDRMDDTITFFRLEKPLEDGVRSYVSPDRRHHYTQFGDLFYPEGALIA